MDLAYNVMRVLQSLKRHRRQWWHCHQGGTRQLLLNEKTVQDRSLELGNPVGGEGMASDETRQGGNGEWRSSRQVEMPVFTGENPDSWIFQADRYFATYGLTEEEKLVAAAMSLDGDALSWY